MKGPPARHQEPKEQYPAVEGIILDAGELATGDRVVYPNQGVCRITGVESKEIAGQKLDLVRMVREEDGAAVLVPKGKVPTIGLRKVATGDQIEGVFHYLAAQYDDPELDWKVRHRDNADRLIAGGVLGVAEVVKGLHALSRIRPLPAKEREQYDNARHLLVHEIAVSLAVPPALAEDYIDYALMPPPGVTFKLKPPPKPVELPSRPRRKVVRTDDEDLGFDELGLDLDLPEVPGALGEAPEAEGAEGAGGEEALLPEIPSADDISAPEALGDAEELTEEHEGGDEFEHAEAEEKGEEEGEGEDEGEAEEGSTPSRTAQKTRGAEPAAKPDRASEKAPRAAAKVAAPVKREKKAAAPKPAAKKPAARPERAGEKAPRAAATKVAAPVKREKKAAAPKPAAKKAAVKGGKKK